MSRISRSAADRREKRYFIPVQHLVEASAKFWLHAITMLPRISCIRGYQLRVMVENVLQRIASGEFQFSWLRPAMSLSCPKNSTLTRTPES